MVLRILLPWGFRRVENFYSLTSLGRNRISSHKRRKESPSGEKFQAVGVSDKEGPASERGALPGAYKQGQHQPSAKVGRSSLLPLGILT